MCKSGYVQPLEEARIRQMGLGSIAEVTVDLE